MKMASISVNRNNPQNRLATQAEDSGEIEIADAIWDELKVFVEA